MWFSWRMSEPPPPVIVDLAAWDGPWAADDPDANFKAEVASYGKLDPLHTIGNLADNLDMPVGAICRYILAKWASAGAEALMTLGPTALNRMSDTVAQAEAEGTDAARLAAYEVLRQQVSWLRVPLDDPSVYPDPAQD